MIDDESMENIRGSVKKVKSYMDLNNQTPNENFNQKIRADLSNFSLKK